MKKQPKDRRKRRQHKPTTTSSAIVPVDKKAVEELVNLAFRGDYVLVPTNRPTPPAASQEDRNNQILRSFFDRVDFDQLEDDIERLQQVEIWTNRGGDDEASEALSRAVGLLESLLDTGETCNLVTKQQ